MDHRLSIGINYMAFESYQYLMKYKENINCDLLICKNKDIENKTEFIQFAKMHFLEFYDG